MFLENSKHCRICDLKNHRIMNLFPFKVMAFKVNCRALHHGMKKEFWHSCMIIESITLYFVIIGTFRKVGRWWQ